MSQEKYLTIENIVEITGGKLIYGNKNIICKNFSRDTRTLKKEDIYLGIKGENFNGSNFYLEALEKGAKACILQDVDIDLEKVKLYSDIAIVKVSDVTFALGQIASFKRNLYDIPVIAITGSVGKTSTKDIVASVLSKKYKVLKTQGNLNNQIGLPLTILGLTDEDALVVEMGMGATGEISTLSKIAKPDIAIITNIGTSHIGNLGSRENILKAKLEILDGLKENGKLIINNDNDLLHKWYLDYNAKNIVTFGIIEDSMFKAQNIKLEDNNSNYDIIINNETYHIQVNIGGKHFIYNSLCALAIGIIFDISVNQIKDGIQNFELTKSRMEIINRDNYTIINDCYNASFDSMKASLEYLSSQKAKRKIAVLGDMLELGDFSKKLHENVGNEVAKNNIDILITVGNESKYIAESAILHGISKDNVFCFNNNQDAINKVNDIKNSDDIILVKASNGMNFKQIVNLI